MDKRYQVFVSSTYTDLKEERKAIIESLLNAKYIPAGMEMFSASNDEQFKYIKKIIDSCDYYVLIIGGRYGTINPSTGISFTEQEYDYAISKNIPVLVFPHEDPNNLPHEKRDDENRELLKRFRDKAANNRLCKMWKNSSELVANVIISLSEEVSENPQLGWIRGGAYDTTELLQQINDLRLNNEVLERALKDMHDIIEESSVKVENLASGDDKYIIIGFNSIYEEVAFGISWDDIFRAIGPHLTSYVSLSEYSNLLEKGLSIYCSELYRLRSDCIQTIRMQFKALGLIKITEATFNGRLTECIKLTKKGEQYLLEIMAIKKVK